MKCVVVFAAVVALATCAPQGQPTQEPIAIIKQASDISPDGSFQWEYETANQIQAEARGILNNAGSENEALSVTGSFSFVADDGQTYTVTYIADENGFQPQGAHLPTPPPVPEAIQRALEYNAAHPEEDQEQQQPPQLRQRTQQPQPPQQAGLGKIQLRENNYGRK